MRRQARLFALAEHLRARRTGVTAAELADRFGVTLRTIYRDLDALREAELPISAERGRGGGYALDRTYSLPPVNFTAREAALLSALGDWAIRMRLVPFTRTLQGSIDKVRGALAASAQRELLELMRELSFVGIPAHPAAVGVREAVEDAWFERRVTRIRYRASDGTISDRRVRVAGAHDGALARRRCTATTWAGARSGRCGWTGSSGRRSRIDHRAGRLNGEAWPRAQRRGNSARALDDLLDAEAEDTLGTGDGGRRLGRPVELQGAGQLERRAGLGVYEEQPRGWVDGGIAERLKAGCPE